MKELKARRELWPIWTACIVLPAALYTISASMVRVWISNETFTHGFLIMPIALWLVWLNRSQQISKVGPDFRALLFLVPVVGLWIISEAVGVAAVAQLSLVALIGLSVWLFAGSSVAKTHAFPLAYLFFMVPLGQALIPPMMEFTADFTVSAIIASGIPIYREGLTFSLPSGNWSVVEECSGVRYLIASAALGTIYAHLTYRSLWKRALFILAALTVPILANGLRAYGIVMLGHFSGMRLAAGVDHLLYGWIFFGVVIFLMFWVGGLWADTTQDHGSQISPVQKNASREPTTQVNNANIVNAVAGISIFAFVLLLISLSLTSRGEANYEGLSKPAAPQIAEYTKSQGAAKSWRPEFHNPDWQFQQSYVVKSSKVTLSVAWYVAQRDGAEAVSSLNRLTNPYTGQWKLTTDDWFKSSDGIFKENELRLEAQRLLVWSRYRVGPYYESNPYLAKAWQAMATLHGRHDAAMLVLATPIDTDRATAQARLDDFWLSAIAPVNLALDSALEANAQ
ncbi:exosortase A [Congregibacter variabilis]|uniref:Exosortase A n=1 Tax=Congregibacter variabilis TaxID=3081200 RepID=A0ABZ0I6A4_9GAMM|nr:exosortase A [Congregibacter sp. IMCC43200]